ncbi:hypothetical protein [Microbulbifer sp. VAAF005]|uniref:hypothetical protein n=1 Tax=unclassified Microbulbifer TaxID=2619833 RepID=UPI0024AD6643|nr:hypothetical protein [Microbulbifer sp. VAAF005]WHI45408.1 hypothetical protein P0078_16970 [Microbulbifer sp. VAAF005]
MNKLPLIILISLLSACATYKVEPEDKFSEAISDKDAVAVTRVNKWPEGNHCFEPMMYVLTLGIIPTHCINTYSVSSGSQELGQVKVTSMQGWVALLIAPFPNWQYGYTNEVESEIKDMVQVAE